MTLQQQNNAIAAYMGGPKYLKDKHFKEMPVDEFLLVTPEDLRFHESWDWMIPVWSKIRHEIGSIEAVMSCISYIDTDNLADFHAVISNVAVEWCKKQKFLL